MGGEEVIPIVNFTAPKEEKRFTVTFRLLDKAANRPVWTNWIGPPLEEKFTTFKRLAPEKEQAISHLHAMGFEDRDTIVACLTQKNWDLQQSAGVLLNMDQVVGHKEDKVKPLSLDSS